MIQFIIIDIYMKNIDEKEKKLSKLFETLRNLKIKNNEDSQQIEILQNHKNQLQIEKKELEEKFESLSSENYELKKQFEDFKKKIYMRKKKRRILIIKLMN